jgi:aminoglycoside phosphotransferase (APT) family kinase protein
VSRPWDGEVELDAAGVRALMVARFPALAHHDPVPVGAGWDNAAWRVGERIFRFPRKELAVKFLRAEIGVLPALDLPFPVPVPDRVADPGDPYPFPWAGYRELPGTTGCSADLGVEARAALAGPLGASLSILHAHEIPPGTPGDVIGRADLPRRAVLLRERFREILGDEGPFAGMDALADTPPWDGPPVLVHGDLYPRHVLVHNGRISGIIDWGDVHAGDPALDLAIAHAFVPSSAREAFFDAYGPVDAATRDRARFHAWRYAAALGAFGRSVGDAGMERMSRWAREGAAAA